MPDELKSTPHEHVKGGIAYTCYCPNPPAQPKTTDRVVTEDRFGRQWLWEPTAYLRFRERERGMVLEQKFVGTSFGEPTRSEWRPVEVVPGA